jgi:hypothetical protein
VAILLGKGLPYLHPVNSMASTILKRSAVRAAVVAATLCTSFVPSWTKAQNDPAGSPELSPLGQSAPPTVPAATTTSQTSVSSSETTTPATADKSDTQKAVDAANAAAATAKAAVDQLQTERFEQLKQGKFIQYGITGGVAAALQTGWSSKGTDGAEQLSNAVTAMPYALIVPAYWWQPDITATYCATKYGTDSVTAQEAARSYSVRKVVATLSPSRRTAYDNGDATVRDEVDQEARQLWNPTLGGKCGLTRIAFFVGKPLEYDASVKPSSKEEQQKMKVNSFAALGMGYAPNAYVTVLAGVSLNYIEISGKEAMGDQAATPDKLRRFTTAVFAIGGNIDIVGSIFKGL